MFAWQARRERPVGVGQVRFEGTWWVRLLCLPRRAVEEMAVVQGERGMERVPIQDSRGRIASIVQTVTLTWLMGHAS